MKRKKIYIYYLSVLLALFILEGCNFSRVSTLGRRASRSIEQSKEIGTFLSEYVPSKIYINDSIQFCIKEVFTEKQFGQYSYSNPSYTIENNKSQLIIILEKKISSLKGYSNTWRLDVNLDKPDRLSVLFDTIELPDSISINVLRIDTDTVTGLAGKFDNEKIGKFTLVKLK